MRVNGKWLMPLCLTLAAGAGLASATTGAPAPAPANLETVTLMRVDGSVTIDAQGQVAEYQIATKLSPSLVELVRRATLTWRFEPVLIDGTPHRVSASMRLALVARPVGDRYQVAIDNVLFPYKAEGERLLANGAPAITGRKLTPPTYPREMQIAGVSGTVLLGIRIGSDGRAEAVVARQSMIFDKKGQSNLLNAAIARFEKAAVRAAWRWTFNLPPGARSANDRTVGVPVEFQFMNTPDSDVSGRWRTLVRSPKRKLDWVPEEAALSDVGVSDLSAGELYSATGALKLTSKLDGTPVL